MRRPQITMSRSVVLALVLVGSLAASGCAPSGSPAERSTPSASSDLPSPEPTEAALVPDGSAADNLALFAQVVDAVATAHAQVQGRAYIDALVAAGFPKDAMEVTQDLTSVGNPADSIQFSVRWADECLVGQVGPSVATPTSLVLPLVPGDTCLIGQTRPIDW